MISCTRTRFPVPEAAEQSHSITLPPPCLTVGRSFMSSVQKHWRHTKLMSNLFFCQSSNLTNYCNLEKASHFLEVLFVCGYIEHLKLPCVNFIFSTFRTIQTYNTDFSCLTNQTTSVTIMCIRFFFTFTFLHFVLVTFRFSKVMILHIKHSSVPTLIMFRERGNYDKHPLQNVWFPVSISCSSLPRFPPHEQLSLSANGV